MMKRPDDQDGDEGMPMRRAGMPEPVQRLPHPMMGAMQPPPAMPNAGTPGQMGQQVARGRAMRPPMPGAGMSPMMAGGGTFGMPRPTFPGQHPQPPQQPDTQQIMAQHPDWQGPPESYGLPPMVNGMMGTGFTPSMQPVSMAPQTPIQQGNPLLAALQAGQGQQQMGGRLDPMAMIRMQMMGKHF